MSELPEPDRGFARGLAASALLHLALIGWLIFGGPLFDEDEAAALQIAEVSLITGAEFDAALSTAPAPPQDAPAPTAPPRQAADETPAPAEDAAPSRAEAAAPEAPERPDERLSADASAGEPPRPVDTAPDAPEAAEADAPPQGLVPVASLAPEGPERLDLPNRPTETPSRDAAPPKRADRVASTPSPDVPDAVEDDETREEVAEGESETPVQEEASAATAPPETTTEIVTEADQPEAEVGPAPLATAPPRGRPDSVAAAAEAARAEEEERETAEAAPEPAPADQPREETPAARPTEGERATASSTDVPLGPQLTRGEIEGVRLGLKQRWRIDRVINLPNYEELVVTLRIRLDPAGKVVGGPDLVAPSSLPDSRFKVAFDTARIALLRAQPYSLPPEKYGRWKEIEVTFNPKKGVFF